MSGGLGSDISGNQITDSEKSDHPELEMAICRARQRTSLQGLEMPHNGQSHGQVGSNRNSCALRGLISLRWSTSMGTSYG